MDYHGNRTDMSATHQILAAVSMPVVSLKEALGGTGGTTDAFCSASGREYVGSKFAASSSFSLTRADVEMKKNNSPTGDVVVEIWTHNSGADSPGTLIATSAARDASIYGAAYGYQAFSFSGVALTSGVIYWIVCFKVTASGTNYLNINAGSGAVNRTDRSADSVTWTLVGSHQIRANLYGQ
jgi:hypothetical protein